MISHMIKWDHSEDWFVTKFETRNTEKSGERVVQLNINDQVFEYLAGHTIDGKTPSSDQIRSRSLIN